MKTAVRTSLTIGFWLIVLFGVAWALVTVRELLLLGFGGVLVAAVFTFPVDLLSRFLPRALAVVLTLLLVLGVIAGMCALVAPTVADQLTKLVESIPRAAERLDGWASSLQSKAQDGGSPGDAGAASIAEKVQQGVFSQLGSMMEQAIPAAMTAVEIATGLVLVLAMGAFLSYSPSSYRGAIARLVPDRHVPVLNEAWRRAGQTLRRWMGGILVSMSVTGVLTAVGLWAAGIEGWFLLALITFFGSFVPYAGPIASSVPGLIVALAQSPLHLLYAMLVYVGVHMAEGYIVQPLVMKKAVSLRPGTLLAWQVLVGALFGPLGIITATPLLAVVQVLVGYLYVERVLGRGDAAALPVARPPGVEPP